MVSQNQGFCSLIHRTTNTLKPPAFILEINTRIWLRQLGGGTPLPLDQVADSVLDQWENQGFDAVWLMGVWHIGNKSREIARSHEGLQAEYRAALPDLVEEDITGSPYAIANYTLCGEMGTNHLSLVRFRQRLNDRGIRLLLDFVPNHTALDHPWVLSHPSWYRQGTEEEAESHPASYFRTNTLEGEKIIAHGRDPYFPAWTDTAQLNYCDPELQEAMRDQLLYLVSVCDGIRCDMAMLVLSDVIEQVWGNRPESEFWTTAIHETRLINPDFLFMAEVYWDKDQQLLDMGFNLTYDKIPLDRAVHGPYWDRQLFDLPKDEHERRVRFLENHDEKRIASQISHDRHFAAAGWLLSLPTTRLIYEGQLEGAKVRLPVQLLRAPFEEPDGTVRDFYERLLTSLKLPVVREGSWTLLETRSAWMGNESYQRILGQGYDLDNQHIRIFVNWADHRSQGWVDLQLGEHHGKEVVLRDQIHDISYIRDEAELMMRGLYLDIPAWHVHVFTCEIRERLMHEESKYGGNITLPDVDSFTPRFNE
jgi:hypothetical protein